MSLLSAQRLGKQPPSLHNNKHSQRYRRFHVLLLSDQLMVPAKHKQEKSLNCS